MCGRYQFTEPQNADLRRILQDVRRRCGDRAQDFRFGDVMPTAAAPPKQISWRFVRLNAIFVLILDKSFGTFT